MLSYETSFVAKLLWEDATDPEVRAHAHAKRHLGASVCSGIVAVGGMEVLYSRRQFKLCLHDDQQLQMRSRG
jgi:hypothetical protein